MSQLVTGVRIDPVDTEAATFENGQFKDAATALVPDPPIHSTLLQQRYVEFERSKTVKAGTFRIAGAGGRTVDVHSDDIYTLVFAKTPMNLSALVPKSMGGKYRGPRHFHASSKSAIFKEYSAAMQEYVHTQIGTIDLEQSMLSIFGSITEHFGTLTFPGQGAWNTLFVSSGMGMTDFTEFDASEGWQTQNKGMPDFGWDNKASSPAIKGYNSAYRLPCADFDEGGERGDRKSFELGDVRIGQIRRHTYCEPDCKCYGTRKKKKVTARKAELDTKKIDVGVLQASIVRQYSEPLVRRIFRFLDICGQQWWKVYGAAIRLGDSAKTDADKKLQKEAKEAFLEFDTFMKDLNAKLGIKWNKKVRVKVRGKWKILGFRVRAFDMKMSGKWRATGVYKKATNVLSPIFPISDGGGYRVYGSYAYGRGVDIQSETGWRKLIGDDPLEELDDAVVDAFVRGVLKSGTDTLTSQIDKSPNTDTSGMLKALMDLQKTNPAAFSRVLKILKVGTGKKLDDGSYEQLSIEEHVKNKLESGRLPKTDEMKNMLAIGLINHFNRDDTPGTYTSPLNAAHSLADIMPGGRKSGADPTVGDEVLWDSMVRLAAGDGESFLYVQPEGADGEEQSNVVKIIQQQIVESTMTHFPIQDEYRGQRELPRTVVDFSNMFANWGATGDWGDTAMGSAFNTLGQVFKGETPDDPKLAAAYEKANAAAMQVHQDFNAGALYEEDPAKRAEKLARHQAEYLEGGPAFGGAEESDPGVTSDGASNLGADGEEVGLFDDEDE